MLCKKQHEGATKQNSQNSSSVVLHWHTVTHLLCAPSHWLTHNTLSLSLCRTCMSARAHMHTHTHTVTHTHNLSKSIFIISENQFLAVDAQNDTELGLVQHNQQWKWWKEGRPVAAVLECEDAIKSKNNCLFRYRLTLAWHHYISGQNWHRCRNKTVSLCWFMTGTMIIPAAPNIWQNVPLLL